MHNLKDIRNNTEAFSESLKKRFIDLDLNMILKMDENNKCKLWNYSESTNEYNLFFTQLMFELWKAELLIKPENFDIKS